MYSLLLYVYLECIANLQLSCIYIDHICLKKKHLVILFKLNRMKEMTINSIKCLL